MLSGAGCMGCCVSDRHDQAWCYSAWGKSAASAVVPLAGAYSLSLARSWQWAAGLSWPGEILFMCAPMVLPAVS
jgi:hypothetical protein